jgi:inosose dehydratase
MTIHVANAPCSWGILEFDGMGDALTWSTVLDEIAESGYRGTELGDWGFMPTNPAALKQEILRRGLSMLGAFVPVALAEEAAFDEGVEEALKVARLLAAVGDQPWIVLSDDNAREDHRTLNAGRIQAEHGLSSDEMKAFGDRASRLAKTVFDATGLKTVFHHHCAGFVETPDEVSSFLSCTDPEVLGLCLDTGHYHYGGGDALSALKKHGSRVWHVHFKDCHPEIAKSARVNRVDYFEAVRRGVFCELGQGDVDFKSVLAELRGQNYQGWVVVEQDVLPGMGTPFESAQRNRTFLRQLGL